MKGIEQTLAEQMQINDREIASRMSLLDFSTADINNLKRHKEFITKYIDEIVDEFYNKQVEVPEIALLIGDAETLRRLRNAMQRYILELFDGHYDSEYVNRRLRIGKVHKRIGVAPKLYISAIWLLQSVLFDFIDNHAATECPEENHRQLKRSLNKLLMLDTQFVFDTYILSLVTEVESAKEELQTYTITLEETIAERTSELQRLSRMDSLTDICNQNAFYEHLRRELNAAERYQGELSLIYLDLDGFKNLNDTHGHKKGDELLALVGGIMKSIIRDCDIACRYGGDEFAIILPRTGVKDAKDVAGRLIDEFKKQNTTDVTFSIGIATTGPEEFLGTDLLVSKADRMMYQSKEKSHLNQDFYISS